MALRPLSARRQPKTADPVRVQSLLSEAIAQLNAGHGPEALATIAALDRAGEVGPVAATLLGLVAMSAGAHDMALGWFAKALTADQNFVEALKGRATALTDSGQAAEADVAFERAFRAGCVDPAAHYHHGNALAALGLADAAVAAYDRAVALKPDYPEALRASGSALRESRGIEPALQRFDRALALRPTYVEAIIDKANLLESRDRLGEAITTLDAGLACTPGHPQLLNNRGVALLHIGRLEEASESLSAALDADPTLAQAYLNRGHVEIRRHCYAEALNEFDAALNLRPDYAEAHCSRGVALKLLGRYQEAATALENALRLDPTSVYALTNRGELRLLLGDFEGGWPDYASRFSTRGHDKPALKQPVPEWTGLAEPGRIAVFADQAAGDIIHFVRYLPVLRAAGADVTLICRPRMQRLLRLASEGCRVVATVGEDETFNHQIPLSSLPYACRTTEATIPALPYLAAEPDLVRLYGDRLGAGFKVGLCWRGSQSLQSDPKRSVPLADMRRLAEVPGVRLVSLQMSDNLGTDTDSIAAMGIETFETDLDLGDDSFIETAAVMANLDLVISCDTSIAHLAGALGRPTFVLLRDVPEWRFMLEREDSPWYPSMRLFRQTVHDDWSQPVAQLAAVMEKLVVNRQTDPSMNATPSVVSLRQVKRAR